MDVQFVFKIYFDNPIHQEIIINMRPGLFVVCVCVHVQMCVYVEVHLSGSKMVQDHSAS